MAFPALHLDVKHRGTPLPGLLARFLNLDIVFEKLPYADLAIGNRGIILYSYPELLADVESGRLRGKLLFVESFFEKSTVIVWGRTRDEGFSRMKDRIRTLLPGKTISFSAAGSASERDLVILQTLVSALFRGMSSHETTDHDQPHVGITPRASLSSHGKQV